ncbi:EAL domain-containing protein [Alteromonadaceae bacterium BrNp21-10]|nr:EAL domain-containing protein [Alteromonadaceae bacterium BrNp21-10]
MQINEVVDGFDIDNIVPYFQPIVDLSTQSVISYECLARLVTSAEHMFLPSEFLNLVEKEHCFGQLAQRIFHLSAQYFHSINVGWSINISEQDIADVEFAEFLIDHLSGYPNPQRVTLEVMATAVTQDCQKFESFIALCKRLGICVYLDRFAGTSNNLSKVLQLPIDGIKLDGTLVKRLADSQDARDVVENIVTLAGQNNIAVIAEHIEDKATLEAVQALNVNYGQGFYFSYPQAQTSK